MHKKQLQYQIVSVKIGMFEKIEGGAYSLAKCEICDKGIRNGHRISINRSQVSRRANKTWKPNIRRVKIVQDGVNRSINICARCLRAGKVTRAS